MASKPEICRDIGWASKAEVCLDIAASPRENEAVIVMASVEAADDRLPMGTGSVMRRSVRPWNGSVKVRLRKGASASAPMDNLLWATAGADSGMASPALNTSVPTVFRRRSTGEQVLGCPTICTKRGEELRRKNGGAAEPGSGGGVGKSSKTWPEPEGDAEAAVNTASVNICGPAAAFTAAAIEKPLPIGEAHSTGVAAGPW